jgi:ABC-2 type transport system ATP-binding protein
MDAIKIENLVKKYKNGVKALNDLNLIVKKGEIFSLLGPNGAGKSSLINILTTYYKKTSGKTFIFEKEIDEKPAWVRSKIACVSQNISIDEHMSLVENMIFQSKLYKIDAHTAKNRIDTLIKQFELQSYLKYPVASYSGGIKRRLDIAMHMVSNPKILFLDEPTTGLDISSRKNLWEIIKKIQHDFKTTIFLTTHYLEEAEMLSDTICIINEGKEIACGSYLELEKYIPQNIVKIGFLNEKLAEKSYNFLKNQKNNLNINLQKKYIFINISQDKKVFEIILNKLLVNKFSFESAEIVKPKLEDIFLKLTEVERRTSSEYNQYIIA